MPEHRPAADEALNRSILIQAGIISVIAWIWEVIAMGAGLLGTALGLLVFLGTPVACWLLTRAVRGVSARFATGLIGGLASAGNIKYQQGYSKQESLIARGRFDEAVESFEVHLLEFPDDLPARYRLATLHLRERNDPAAAEAEFLNIRRRQHDRSMAMLLANHLVDLYRATGQKGKLMAELTKMMKEWPGTPMADGAAKLLEETKRDRA
ncbi:MAG TPA: tetratricopeptide repeat protein [Gemmatimonadales bacterium]